MFEDERFADGGTDATVAVPVPPEDDFLVRPEAPRPAAAPVPAEGARESLFLRRVGTRTIGEIEVPEAREPVAPPERSTASGFGPDRSGEDLSAPAYSRKYMD